MNPSAILIIVMVARTLGIMILSLYAYGKLLGTNAFPKRKKLWVYLILLIVFVDITYIIPIPSFSEGLLIIPLFIFVSITARVKLWVMLASIVISLGIVLGFETVSNTLLFMIMDLLNFVYAGAMAIREGTTVIEHMRTGMLLSTVYENNPVILLPDFLPPFIQFALTVLFFKWLFKSKQVFTSPFFLEGKGNLTLGLILSIIIMSIRVLAITLYGILTGHYSDAAFENGNASTIVTLFEQGYIWLFTFIGLVSGICLIGMYKWWHYQATVKYQQRLKEKIYEEQVTEVKNLKASNDFLAKAMHRDNKLIPAMYSAVAKLLEDAKNKNTQEWELQDGNHILQELDKIMQERKESISAVQRNDDSIPPTGMWRVDNILNYMWQKAYDKEIQFDFRIAENIKDIIAESQLSEEKLSTLLADLIENAIVAVSHSEHKKISVEMGMVYSSFEITTEDSGIPFEAETLANLGLKKSTTHANTGGSGIGYMTIFEILKESGASLAITEFAPENYAFTKAVKIRFDGKSKYAANSYRANEIKAVTERKDLSIFENQ